MFGPGLKMCLCNKLRAPKIGLVDHSKWEKHSPNILRELIDTNCLTEVSNEAWGELSLSLREV